MRIVVCGFHRSENRKENHYYLRVYCTMGNEVEFKYVITYTKQMHSGCLDSKNYFPLLTRPILVFLEIFVRKFKRGNQQVLVQNWVKNVVINKCSLSKNLKNGPKLQL